MLEGQKEWGKREWKMLEGPQRERKGRNEGMEELRRTTKRHG